MKARKNRAFFVETLIITFLLLLMLTILVRIFGAAAQKSRYAERRTQAAQVAQNVVAMFEAGEGAVGEAQQELIDTANDEYSEIETPQTTITLHFDEMGNPTDDGVYQVTLFMTCEVRAVGNMITGNMDIVHVDQPEENLAQLDTAIYFPDDVDAVLSTDEAIDFESIARTETEAMTEEGSVFPAQEEQTADSDQTEAAS
jgi:ABC-type Na+ efflux pump permease subunit